MGHNYCNDDCKCRLCFQRKNSSVAILYSWTKSSVCTSPYSVSLFVFPVFFFLHILLLKLSMLDGKGERGVIAEMRSLQKIAAAAFGSDRPKNRFGSRAVIKSAAPAPQHCFSARHSHHTERKNWSFSALDTFLSIFTHTVIINLAMASVILSSTTPINYKLNL